MGFRSENYQKVKIIMDRNFAILSSKVSRFLNTHNVKDFQYSTTDTRQGVEYSVIFIYEPSKDEMEVDNRNRQEYNRVNRTRPNQNPYDTFKDNKYDSESEWR